MSIINCFSYFQILYYLKVFKIRHSWFCFECDFFCSYRGNSIFLKPALFYVKWLKVVQESKVTYMKNIATCSINKICYLFSEYKLFSWEQIVLWELRRTSFAAGFLYFNIVQKLECLNQKKSIEILQCFFVDRIFRKLKSLSFQLFSLFQCSLSKYRCYHLVFFI